MTPTSDFDATVLDNARDFKDPFYTQFALRPGQPLKLSEKIEKTYLFPTLYGDVTCAMGIFLCSYAKAERLMPHPRIKPVRMPRGRSIVAFSCYEYKQVLGVAPYNEIAMTIPVMLDPKFNVPVLPMIAPDLPGFGYYVFSMPVTSLENQIRGRKIWGLPKVVEEIELREDEGTCLVTSKESSGETYFTLRIPRLGKATPFDVRSDLYSRLDDRLLKSETRFKATFAVTKYPDQILRKNTRPNKPFLKLGDSPSGRVLKDLEIEPHALEVRYAQHMTSAFALPDPSFTAPFRF